MQWIKSEEQNKKTTNDKKEANIKQHEPHKYLSELGSSGRLRDINL